MRDDEKTYQDHATGFAGAPSEDLSFTLTDEEIRQISTAVHAQDSDTVHAILKALNAADMAEVLSKVSDEIRTELLVLYADFLNPEVFAEMDTELARKTLSAMPANQIASIISALESDDALLLIDLLDEDLQRDIIRKLSAKTRMAVEEGLSFPEDSAGRLMRREVVAVPQFWTAGKTLDYLRAAAADLPEDFFDIFVIDPAYHFKGQFPLSRLVRAGRLDKIETLTYDEIQPIPADMDQEEVTHLFRRENIVSSPVVDAHGRLLGMITIDDIIDVIDEEAQEDILKMGGVGGSDIFQSPLTTSITRSWWLGINLLTAFLASAVVGLFSETIDKIVALAVLMPIVAGMGGNAGTQTLAVIVRAIAVRELSGTNTPRAIYKEAMVGFLNGLIFAVLTGAAIAIWFHDIGLGGVIASAMTLNLFAAGFFGACIPIVLSRMGQDPAIASSIFLTTVTDVVGFFAFLGLAAIFLV